MVKDVYTNIVILNKNKLYYYGTRCFNVIEGTASGTNSVFMRLRNPKNYFILFLEQVSIICFECFFFFFFFFFFLPSFAILS